MAMRLGNQVPAARGLGNLRIGSMHREEGVMKLHRTMHSGIDDGEWKCYALGDMAQLTVCIL